MEKILEEVNMNSENYTYDHHMYTTFKMVDSIFVHERE